MGIRREGSSLTTSGQIARPKIGDGGHPGPFSDDRRLGNLQRGPDTAKAWLADWLREMVNGLPVRADQVDVRQSQTRFLDNPERRLRKHLAQQGIQMTDLLDISVGGNRQDSP